MPDQAFRARMGQPADRVWIYDSPYNLPRTVVELRNAYPRAQVWTEATTRICCIALGVVGLLALGVLPPEEPTDAAGV